jgi:amino acid transporter
MTRRTALIAFLVGVALAGAGSVARAHHAFAAEFDVNKPIKFEGKLIYLIMIVPLILCLLLIFALIPDVMHGPLFNPPALAPHQSHPGH